MSIFIRFFKGFLSSTAISIACIVLLWFIASILNIKSGHYLIGWDNLQVELNYWENLKRSFFSAWNEYYGLGAPSGHANSVEFVRLVIFAPLYLTLPNWLFRYATHLLCWLFGGLSIYFLSRYITKNIDSKYIQVVPFIVSIFYMYNIGTVQVFYAPLEPFSFFYAFLPLSIYSIIKFLDNGKKANYLFLIGSLLLLSISFQIQTFFFVFCFIIFPSLIAFFIFYLFKKNRVNVTRILLIFIAVIFVNIYWLPNSAYFVLNNINIRYESTTNRLSSEDAFLSNLRYSNISDISQLRSFWLANIDYNNKTDDFGYMMQPWMDWIGSSKSASYFYSLVAFLSLVVISIHIAIKRKLNKSSIFLISVFFTGGFFLYSLNNPYPFDVVYTTFIHNISFLREMFRYTYTKWGTVYIFGFSVLIGIAFALLISFLDRHFKKYSLILVAPLVSIFLFSTIFNVFPIFKGQLFYDNLELELPNEYRETFQYFKDEDINARIMNLPQPVFWGWGFNKWGYRGSGFLWWGISQPIMDRVFDVWSSKNEQYYAELQNALYSNNANDFVSVLNKYNIQYIFLDNSIFIPDGLRAVDNEGLKIFLSSINGLELDKTFGFISIYKFNPNYTKNPVDSNSAGKSYIDLRGNYYSDRNEIYYPFASDTSFINEFSNNLPLNNEAKHSIINISSEYIRTFTSGLFSIKFQNDALYLRPVLPDIVDKDGFFVESFVNDGSAEIIDFKKLGVVNPNIVIGNSILSSQTLDNETFLLEKNQPIYLFDSDSRQVVDLSNEIYSTSVTDCGYNSKIYGKDYDIYPDSLILSTDKVACLSFDRKIDLDAGSLVKISFDAKIDSNSNFYYCLLDSVTEECLNKKYLNRPSVGNVYTRYEDFVYIPNKSIVTLQFSIEGLHGKKLVSGYVKNLNIEYYNAESISIDYADLLDKLFIKKQILIKNDEELYISNLPKSKFVYDFDWLKRNLYIDAYQCDPVNQSGSFNRTIDSRGVEYASKNAALCDSVVSLIDARGSYVLNISTENVEGLPLELCIESLDKTRCAVRSRINESSEGASSHFIIPSLGENDAYIINFVNKSVGEIESKNIIKDFSLEYAPYRFLKSLYLTSNDTKRQKVESIMAKRKSGWFYEVKVESSKSSGEAILVLDQAYNTGWLAIEINKHGMPGFKVFNHVLYNNWANAWVVPAVSASYVIIFWPQYLQFAGYLVLAIFIVVLGFSVCTKRKFFSGN